ncbi:MAG TPA: DUF1761 domain-containing protein [Bacteroidales bacterium]|nr:DUF1761 domain-containing protein [Bacteroidales bacterium]
METLNAISTINWLAVIVVTVVSFALGALWHSPLLFGKAWSKEINRNKDQKIDFKLIFGLSLVANFAALVMLAAFIGNASTALQGLIDGLLISIFWITSSIGVTYLFATRSLKLFLIDAGYYIVFFSIAGMILGAWQ